MHEVLIVDDDEVSRELLVLFATEAGFHALALESGDAALDLLQGGEVNPDAILADMRMEGTHGNALAVKLRGMCGDATKVIAMSGSRVSVDETAAFDGFLLKPFGVEELKTMLTMESPQVLHTEHEAGMEKNYALSEATYGTLAASMPREQLLQLYAMCLDDADRRAEAMKELAVAGDGEAYSKAAHAIKGGCGFVGALELASMASAMEEDGPPSDGNVRTLEQFLMASARLRRILNAHD
ncbi:response regulator [Granulicella tundricola]|uniref:Response regulator receiver and Hpt phospho transfer protein n=1 Tax=Granulicella tundricola (strain ATCC BAA-1859 / DSM 23138 / MP5ACTX9) TaxID=1198114 RepID=E8X056_GRATM|nr:response regulator [Granulicella tundricola]ADW70037.1 response regulator receiver and Hpt phospho transfer protein [Granulicella tundricola MP5ACTX9]